MTDYQPGPEIRAALDAAATSGLILSWRPVPGRGPVVIAGDMAEWGVALGPGGGVVLRGSVGGGVRHRRREGRPGSGRPAGHLYSFPAGVRHGRPGGRGQRDHRMSASGTPDPVAAALAEIRELFSRRDDLLDRMNATPALSDEFDVAADELAAVQDDLSARSPLLLAALDEVLRLTAPPDPLDVLFDRDGAIEVSKAAVREAITEVLAGEGGRGNGKAREDEEHDR